MLVWPNLSRARTVSIHLLLLWDEVQSLTSFLISQLSSLSSQGVPLLMPPVGDGLPKWFPHIGMGGLLYEVLSFPWTLTCPGTQHRSMIISSSSALRISSLVSTTIGEKEEYDLSARRALLESEKIVNRLPSMVPFKISCTAAFTAYNSAVNIEASGKSATTGGVRKHYCKAHTCSRLLIAIWIILVKWLWWLLRQKW